jgi:hypothetical protein
VVAALKDLDQEEANSQLRTLLKKDRRSSPTGSKRDSLSLEKEEVNRRTRAQVKASKTSRSRTASAENDSPLKRQERSETPVQDRPRLSRTSKSAAGAKISAWTNILKPTRTSSAGSLQRRSSDVSDTAVAPTRNSTVPDSEDDLPPILRRSSRKIDISTPDEMRRGKKRVASSSPKPQQQTSNRLRRARERSSFLAPGSDVDHVDGPVTKPRKPRTSNRLHPARESSSFPAPDSDVELADGPETKPRKPRTPRGARISIDPEGILPTQKEHAALFPDHMPKDQHYKRANPTIIRNPLAVEDPDTLDYPVEVPALIRAGINKGKPHKYELWEFQNAEDFREHMEEVAKVLKRDLPGSSSKTPELTDGSTNERELGTASSSEHTTTEEEEEASQEITEWELQRQMLASTPSEQPGERSNGTVKDRIDAQIEVLEDTVKAAAAMAIATSETLTSKGKSRAMRENGLLQNEFMEAVRLAQEAYEDGLAKLGVSLDGPESVEGAARRSTM